MSDRAVVELDGLTVRYGRLTAVADVSLAVRSPEGFCEFPWIQRLVERGHDVICLDNFFSSQKTNVAGLLDRPNFELLTGSDVLSWYQSTPEARRGFCARCGSTLFFESDRWADEVHIALAHMDGPIDRSPKVHVFYDAHVPWVELGDELGKHGGPTGTEPLEPG